MPRPSSRPRASRGSETPASWRSRAPRADRVTPTIGDRPGAPRRSATAAAGISCRSATPRNAATIRRSSPISRRSSRQTPDLLLEHNQVPLCASSADPDKPPPSLTPETRGISRANREHLTRDRLQVPAPTASRRVPSARTLSGTVRGDPALQCPPDPSTSRHRASQRSRRPGHPRRLVLEDAGAALVLFSGRGHTAWSQPPEANPHTSFRAVARPDNTPLWSPEDEPRHQPPNRRSHRQQPVAKLLPPANPARTTGGKIWPDAGTSPSRRPDSNRGPLHYETRHGRRT